VSGLLVLVFGGACPPTAQDDFYRGRTVRIVVGYSAGGGFDTYSRAIARHLAKHIPGKPAVIVENMPGAADLVAANSIYRAGRPDGLTVVNFQGTQVMGQILGRSSSTTRARPGSTSIRSAAKTSRGSSVSSSRCRLPSSPGSGSYSA